MPPTGSAETFLGDVVEATGLAGATKRLAKPLGVVVVIVETNAESAVFTIALGPGDFASQLQAVVSTTDFDGHFRAD